MTCLRSLRESRKGCLPVGEPGKRLGDKHYKVDGSKAVETLKLEEPSLEDNALGLLQQLLKLEAAENA
jgi:hypothetical protein